MTGNDYEFQQKHISTDCHYKSCSEMHSSRDSQTNVRILYMSHFRDNGLIMILDLEVVIKLI